MRPSALTSRAMAAAWAAERPKLTKQETKAFITRSTRLLAPEYVSRTAAAPKARDHDGSSVHGLHTGAMTSGTGFGAAAGL